MSLFASHLLTKRQLDALKETPRLPTQPFQLGDEAELHTYDEMGNKKVLPCYVCAIMLNGFGAQYMLAYLIQDDVYAVIPHYAGNLMNRSGQGMLANNELSGETTKQHLAVVATNEQPVASEEGKGGYEAFRPTLVQVNKTNPTE